MNRSITRIAIAGVAVGFGLATTAPALATPGGDVRRSGNCSGSSTWKLKAKPDDGMLEVEGEVDSNVNGQTWNWKIKHNGSVARHGTARTTGPSGSFSVERRIGDASGTDTVGWRATNPRSGETCSGTLRI